MSTIFLCFDISDVEAVVVNEQCRNQNATSKKIWFHFAALSRTQSQFCSYCIWAPNVFQFALNCWENQRKKNALKLLDQKQLKIFFTTFLLHYYENFIFDSYNSNWVFFHIGFLYFHPHMYLCFCLFFHMFFSLLQFSLYLHNSTW